MAESEREDSEGCEGSVEEKEENRDSVNCFLAGDNLECAVCLQTCIHPVQLPCGHIFCFLCVKGIANQSKRCAMCRHEIPPDYLDHPQLVHKDELAHHSAFDDGFQWFYEGRNGWWQYDERTSYELELAHRRGEKSCELLIAGFLYIVDFENMLQVRRSDPSRRRHVKRDLASIPKKGIAGLRIQIQQNENYASALENWVDRELADGEEGASEMPTTLAMQVARSLDMSTLPTANSSRERTKRSSPTLVPPNNTPQTPHTPSTNSERSSPDITLSEHSLNQAVSGLANLNLNDSFLREDTANLSLPRALDVSQNFESSSEDII